MRYVVTGAAGLIESHLATELLETGNEVLRLVGESVGRPVEGSRVSEQPGDVWVTSGSIEGARQVLSVKPTVSLADGPKRQVSAQLGDASPRSPAVTCACCSHRLTRAGRSRTVAGHPRAQLVVRGVDVHVAYLVDRAESCSELEQAGVPVVSLAGVNQSRRSWLRRTIALLDRCQPDVVHTTLFEADLAGRRAAARRGVPCISSLVTTPADERPARSGCAGEVPQGFHHRAKAPTGRSGSTDPLRPARRPGLARAA